MPKLLSSLFAGVGDYFWPEKAIPQLIIFALLLFFVYWCVRLWQVLRDIRRSRRVLKQSAAMLPELSTFVFHNETAPGESLRNPDSFFERQAEVAGMRPANAVTQHLKSIFLAGCNHSKLDTSELNQQTADRVLSGDLALRMQLSLFVIGGLLGTLFGVADAIAAFAGNLNGIESAKQVPEHLLQGLKGAFAPSITGVLLSILGALAYSAVRGHSGSKFLAELRLLTLRDWIPNLIPTEAQKFAETAYETLKSAQVIVEFAANIKGHSASLNNSVIQAAGAAAKISSAMSVMDVSVNKASTTVAKTLTDLSTRISGFSAVLQQWTAFEEKIDDYQRFVRDAQDRQIEISREVKQQAETSGILFAAIKTNLAESLDKIQNATGNLFEPVEKASTKLEALGERFVEECSRLLTDLKSGTETQTTALRTAHAEELAEVKRYFGEFSRELQPRFQSVVQALDNLKEPYERSARDVRDEAENMNRQFGTRMAALLDVLHVIASALREATSVSLPQPAEVQEVRLSTEDRALLKSLVSTPAPGIEQFRELKSIMDNRLAAIQALLREIALGDGHRVVTRRRSDPVEYGTGEKASTIPRNMTAKT